MPWKSPSHQSEHARVGVLDAAELDLVEPLRAPALEVVGEALGDEADRRIEVGELVGARAGRVLRQPGLAPVAAGLVLLHQRRVDDVDLGHDRQEDRRRLLQLELDGVVVDGLGRAGIDHGLEQRGRALADREDAVERVDDVLRLHLGAVVELDAFAHLERVGEAVGRDRVALGHPRLEHGRVVAASA